VFGYTSLMLCGCFSHRRAPSKPAVSAKRNTPRGTGTVIPCYDPATGLPLDARNADGVRAYTPTEVTAAIAAARAAQAEWGQSSLKERGALLMDILDWIVAK
jgi:acyl-CoA reductase-like NAD-dependent aldehyde dehydrogenase